MTYWISTSTCPQVRSIINLDLSLIAIEMLYTHVNMHIGPVSPLYISLYFLPCNRTPSLGFLHASRPLACTYVHCVYCACTETKDSGRAHGGGTWQLRLVFGLHALNLKLVLGLHALHLAHTLASSSTLYEMRRRRGGAG